MALSLWFFALLCFVLVSAMTEKESCFFNNLNCSWPLSALNYASVKALGTNTHGLEKTSCTLDHNDL